MNERKKVEILLVLLAIGIVISAYLVYVSFNEKALFCATNSIINCETVLTSSYSKVFGVPLSFYAFAWFAIAVAVVKLRRFRKYLKIWSSLGLAGLAYSVASMAEIGKICIYCSSLDIILLANFLVVFWWFNESRRVQD
ncbi:MAG: vitamin K epoxide reductase family protein [Candidatus Micrarchaeia archaeon]